MKKREEEGQGWWYLQPREAGASTKWWPVPPAKGGRSLQGLHGRYLHLEVATRGRAPRAGTTGHAWPVLPGTCWPAPPGPGRLAGEEGDRYPRPEPPPKAWPVPPAKVPPVVPLAIQVPWTCALRFEAFPVQWKPPPVVPPARELA
jgi:hypothetical protein